MPRNRNCVTLNNIELPSEFLKVLPPPDRVNLVRKSPQLSNLYLEESFASEHKKCGFNRSSGISSSSDYDNFSDIVSFDKSSTSSLSWNDDFDSDGTERVKNELEYLDRILQEQEPIPLHYNRDECEQWMKTFPHLSVFGNSQNVTQDKRFSSNTSPELPSSNVKSTVGTPKKPSCKTNKRTDRKSNHLHLYQADKLLKRFDNLLRISPVLLREHTNRSFYLDTRQQSSHSVLKSAKSVSKWLHEEEQSCMSLPHLTPSTSAKCKASLPNKMRPSSKGSPNKNHVSLPPIKVTTVPFATMHYRSISATPREVYKEQSLASAHLDSLKRKQKVIHEKLNTLRNLANLK